ncbi:MAG: alpha-L-fucosidase [Phycisphaeraceae bacterium]
MTTTAAASLAFPDDRLAWFTQARFGMFIHWGLYALLGRGEWVMSREAIPVQEYRLLADRFDAADYDPHAWAALARDAGMRYMVLTAKHHEGFCLWDSSVCAFNAVNSAGRRDLLAEYVDAARQVGLKVGLYYSLGDWHNPDWAAGWAGDTAAEHRFVQYTHALVDELMTRYGRIDVLWYDLPQCYSALQWRSVELNAKVRARQPHILINNRAMTTEDFATPEQHIKASRAGRPWEACMTLNQHWGYCPSDQRYKSAGEVAQTLASVAAGGGNLLLNVGPDPAGRIPPQSRQILRQVRQWLQRHGPAIFDTTPHRMPWYLFGPTTVSGRSLFCHLANYHGPQTTIGGLTNRVLAATLLTTGQPIAFTQRGRQLFLHGLPDQPPSDVLTVVQLQLDTPPGSDLGRVLGGADVFAQLPD